jgi:electron transport complex protein RnfB
VSGVLLAVGIMTGLGLLFGVVLTVAWWTLRVEEDPRIEAVEEQLPGSNCGACGEAGCHAFAEKVVAGEVAPAGCTVSSAEGVASIAKLLGVAAGERSTRVARLACAGGTAEAKQSATYAGHGTCGAAAVASGGGKACPWGCLGLGDCDVACTFAAIHMNTNGLPVVDVAKCTACGDCVSVCPKNLFSIQPVEHALLVQCSATLAGVDATDLCTVACDACGRCAVDAPDELIKIVNNLPVIDYALGGPASASATARCPTGAIVWVPGGQFQAPRQPTWRPHV